MKETTILNNDAERLQGIFSEMKDQVEQLLLLLSERERFVIEQRFALEKPERSTLEEIGQHFSVTRERVRQIEKNALQKLTRNVSNFDVFNINNVAFDLLGQHGGILSEDRMISKLLLQDTGFTVHALLFVLSLDKRFVRLSNTIKFVPYFRIAEISDKLIHSVVQIGHKALEKSGDVMSVESLRSQAIESNGALSVLSPEAVESIFDIHKEFKLIDHKIGLISWKHIHPRTLRDKIFFVLRGNSEPLHFVAIANAIVDQQFDKKRVNLQAVHNELIRYDDFILIGRGIYALKEWGYTAGTVSDIITSLLKKTENMSEDQIIEQVLKQRQVKPITVILNLKNKPQFIRVGRKQYTLKKAKA